MNDNYICKVRLINAFFLDVEQGMPDPWNPTRVMKFDSAESAVSAIKAAFDFFKDGNNWFETKPIDTIQFTIEPIPVEMDDNYFFGFLFDNDFFWDFYSYSPIGGFYRCTGEKCNKPVARKIKEEQMISDIAAQPKLLEKAKGEKEEREKKKREWEEEQERRKREQAIEARRLEEKVCADVGRKKKIFVVEAAHSYTDIRYFAYDEKNEALNVAETLRKTYWSVEVSNCIIVPSKEASIKLWNIYIPDAVDYNGEKWFTTRNEFNSGVLM